MRESSNPIFGTLLKDQKQPTPGHPEFSPGYQDQAYGAPGSYGQNPYGQQGQYADQNQYSSQPSFLPSSGLTPALNRSITIDDVVTKTAMTLGVIIVLAALTYGAIGAGIVDAFIPLVVGAIGGLVMVLIATFGGKMDSPVITLVYAVFEGLFVGAVTFVFAGIAALSDVSVGGLIFQAVAGTFGVFVGMLVVYKTGAIRVTPRFTRIVVGCIFGILGLVVVNLLGSLITGFDMGIRGAGTVGILFSLFCIVIAALSFLLDFDQADKLIRSGAPANLAWGVALGLAVTLVWLYIEILRLLVILTMDR